MGLPLAAGRLGHRGWHPDVFPCSRFRLPCHVTRALTCLRLQPVSRGCAWALVRLGCCCSCAAHPLLHRFGEPCHDGWETGSPCPLVHAAACTPFRSSSLHPLSSLLRLCPRPADGLSRLSPNAHARLKPGSKGSLAFAAAGLGWPCGFIRCSHTQCVRMLRLYQQCRVPRWPRHVHACPPRCCNVPHLQRPCTVRVRACEHEYVHAAVMHAGTGAHALAAGGGSHIPVPPGSDRAGRFTGCTCQGCCMHNAYSLVTGTVPRTGFKIAFVQMMTCMQQRGPQACPLLTAPHPHAWAASKTELHL